MKFDKYQAMKDMIEAAAKDQQKQFEWIGNLYRQRLQNLQETEAKRQEWLKTQQNEEKSKDDQIQ
jgi:hypothetical protein